MKRLVQIGSFMGLLLVLMISVQAQISKTYRVQIPFDFNIGQESYQAGTYQVNLTDSRLFIRNQKTNVVKVLSTSFDLEGKGFEPPQFYFDRVEGKNQLVEVAGKDFNIKLESVPTARSITKSRKRSAPPAMR